MNVRFGGNVAQLKAKAGLVIWSPDDILLARNINMRGKVIITP